MMQAMSDDAGIPQSIADDMQIAPCKGLSAIEPLLNEHKDLAAIIDEPSQRIIPAEPG